MRYRTGLRLLELGSQAVEFWTQIYARAFLEHDITTQSLARERIAELQQRIDSIQGAIEDPQPR